MCHPYTLYWLIAKGRDYEDKKVEIRIGCFKEKVALKEQEYYDAKGYNTQIVQENKE